MVRSDFEDAKNGTCAEYEPEEKEIVKAIAQFYQQAGDAGVCSERARDILKCMIRVEYLVRKSNEYVEAE